MKLLRCMTIACFLLSFLEIVNSAKIMFLICFASKSHMNIFYPLMDGLQSRGHDVIMYAPFINTAGYPKVKQIELSNCRKKVEYDNNQLLSDEKQSSILSFISTYINRHRELMTMMSSTFFENPEIQKLIKEKPQIDLVLTDTLFNDYIFPLASHVFNSRLIAVCTAALSTAVSRDYNVPRPYAYVPDLLTDYTTEMSFKQRMFNTYASLLNSYAYKVMEDVAQAEVSKHIPDAPTIIEAKANVDLIFANADPVMNVPRPILPNVINIGGIHCRDPKPLSKELEDFISDSGEHGFIFFSLGSVLTGSHLPEEIKSTFLKTFAGLKQKVLWKFEEPIENLPSNVKLLKWAPQQDLLGHPKIRLFISHSGMLSMQEAVYHGVPMIGVPVFGDQNSNNARARAIGFAEQLKLFAATPEEISLKIRKILTDKRYKEAAMNCSNIMKDRPMKPLDTAMYWIDYVIRHKGAQHLHVAAKHLNCFQYFLLDVISFVGSVIVITILTLIFVIKFIVKLIKMKLVTPKYKSD